jgi:phosphotransferase system, enzyme I, PtsP
LARVAAAASKAGIPCSVCGEMAHDVRYVPFFVGIGIRQLSLDPHYLPEVQQCILGRTLKEMRFYANALLQETSISGVEKVMKELSGSQV